ncbi:hypothetical protein EYF80_000994 [Liparis tanakae]|uniref:Uncharacterized protein n=1 Tax=Liparis tanakae TaxID=230148 RepID=A0A4Z2JHC8_9TELE|nr:hypothetical protein EYF80_000994 [Liparis tanakae]
MLAQSPVVPTVHLRHDERQRQDRYQGTSFCKQKWDGDCWRALVFIVAGSVLRGVTSDDTSFEKREKKTPPKQFQACVQADDKEGRCLQDAGLGVSGSHRGAVSIQAHQKESTRFSSAKKSDKR